MADITHISTISFTVFTSSGIASSVRKSQWINFVSSPPFLSKIFTHGTTLTIFCLWSILQHRRYHSTFTTFTVFFKNNKLDFCVLSKFYLKKNPQNHENHKHIAKTCRIFHLTFTN